jgi:hypothetical protein
MRGQKFCSSDKSAGLEQKEKELGLAYACKVNKSGNI